VTLPDSDDLPASPGPEPHPAADAIVLREHKTWVGIAFFLLPAVFIAALARAIVQGSVPAGVIFGVLAAATTLVWVFLIRQCGHLEVASQAITYCDAKGRARALNRQPGDELRVVITQSTWTWGNSRSLTDATGSVHIPLNWLKLSQVRQACLARGWQFR